jgi:hypothetical protein
VSWRHLDGARTWFGGGVTGTKIFVSYARPRADRARVVARALEGDGCDVWIDDRLLAHRSFTDAIERAEASRVRSPSCRRAASPVDKG